MVMRTLRNKVSLIVWLSAVLLIAMLVGLVAPNFLTGGKNLNGAPAVVDGQPIDSQEFSNALNMRMDQARKARGGELVSSEETEIRRDTLNALIDEQLALDHAKSLGQAMSPEEFRQDLANDPNFQDQQGHFDESRYESLLQMQAEQGVPWQQAEQNFQRALLLNKVHSFWAAQAVLTPRDETLAETRYNRRVRAQAAVWNLDRLRAGIHLSDEDLHTYYSEHKRDWEKPAQLKLSQILVRADFGSDTTAAKAKAQGILAKLKAGASFKALASKENSDDAARKSGGELGWVAHDDLRHVAVADAAFGLKPGGVSGVIQTTEGFTIVKVEARREGFNPTFANSKSKAALALGTQRAQALALAQAQKTLDALKQGKSLAQAAKVTQGQVVETAWFGRDDAKALPAMGSDPDFAKEMLSLDRGAATQAPLSNDKAVAVAVLLDEKPGQAPAALKDAQARADAARQDAFNTRTQTLYQAWLASLRKKADIVDQSGSLAD